MQKQKEKLIKSEYITDVHLIDPTKEEREMWESYGYVIHSRIQNPPDLDRDNFCPICGEAIQNHLLRDGKDDRIYLYVVGSLKNCLRVILPI